MSILRPKTRYKTLSNQAAARRAFDPAFELTVTLSWFIKHFNHPWSITVAVGNKSNILPSKI